MSDLPTPINRNEQYLNAIANGDPSELPTPISREEQYLDYIAKNGGGSGGDGDMKKSVYDSDLAVANAGGIGAFVGNAVSDKVDKVEGKGLSTNDYDNTEKGKVADNTSAIEAIENVTGAKNLAVYPYKESSRVDSGVTITDNGDGSLTFSGTANDDIYFNWGSANINLRKGKYILTGCPQGGADGVFALAFYDGSDYYVDTGSGVEFTLPTDLEGGTLYIKVWNGGSFGSGKTFYPMIRDARITDPTYTPYAMTNRELTERVENVLNTYDSSDYKKIQYISVSNDNNWLLLKTEDGNYLKAALQSQ